MKIMKLLGLVRYDSIEHHKDEKTIQKIKDEKDLSYYAGCKSRDLEIEELKSEYESKLRMQEYNSQAALRLQENVSGAEIQRLKESEQKSKKIVSGAIKKEQDYTEKLSKFDAFLPEIMEIFQTAANSNTKLYTRLTDMQTSIQLMKNREIE